eukprot:12463914-Ditylum_brightwellii.AAC.1
MGPSDGTHGGDLRSSQGSISTGDCRGNNDVAHRPKKIVVAPPGSLGLTIGKTTNKKGTSLWGLVLNVSSSSQLVGKISKGDRIIEIDGEDVTHKNIEDVYIMLMKKNTFEKALTVLPGPTQEQSSVLTVLTVAAAKKSMTEHPSGLSKDIADSEISNIAVANCMPSAPSVSGIASSHVIKDASANGEPVGNMCITESIEKEARFEAVNDDLVTDAGEVVNASQNGSIGASSASNDDASPHKASNEIVKVTTKINDTVIDLSDDANDSCGEILQAPQKTFKPKDDSEDKAN